jgi:hypothetical protein
MEMPSGPRGSLASQQDLCCRFWCQSRMFGQEFEVIYPSPTIFVNRKIGPLFGEAVTVYQQAQPSYGLNRLSQT